MQVTSLQRSRTEDAAAESRGRSVGLPHRRRHQVRHRASRCAPGDCCKQFAARAAAGARSRRLQPEQQLLHSRPLPFLAHRALLTRTLAACRSHQALLLGCGAWWRRIVSTPAAIKQSMSRARQQSNIPNYSQGQRAAAGRRSSCTRRSRSAAGPRPASRQASRHCRHPPAASSNGAALLELQRSSAAMTPACRQ